jgi:hypothetical protein
MSATSSKEVMDHKLLVGVVLAPLAAVLALLAAVFAVLVFAPKYAVVNWSHDSGSELIKIVVNSSSGTKLPSK